MIDKEKIQKAIDNESCMGIGLICDSCPISENMVRTWGCGKKDDTGMRDFEIGIRPRSIRIMKEWMDAQK